MLVAKLIAIEDATYEVYHELGVIKRIMEFVDRTGTPVKVDEEDIPEHHLEKILTLINHANQTRRRTAAPKKDSGGGSLGGVRGDTEKLHRSFTCFGAGKRFVAD